MSSGSSFERSQGVGFTCHRREFLAAMGVAGGTLALGVSRASAVNPVQLPSRKKEGARVRAAFVYPPSSTFANNPDGWWSWPGNEFDAEGRQRAYTASLRAIEKRLAMRIDVAQQPVGTGQGAKQLADELRADPPDGLLLVMFYNRSLDHADLLIQTAEELEVPVVFYIGLGVKHGSVAHYRHPGVYLIQSLDNMDAIEVGMRIINTKKLMSQCRLLSITEADEPREGVESFLGVTVRVIPFSVYAEAFENVSLGKESRRFISSLRREATETRGVTDQAFENAARGHFALCRLLADEDADGLTMNCLKRGMLKPCVSFSVLNSQLVPAACENDLPAMYTQLLGQLLTGRPGFQHNPCYETERNHYYASHCTCPTRVYGPEERALPYLLRRFAHTNDGSCAIQVFWNAHDPVTMVRYYPGDDPALDVYAGKVVVSHPMPPAGGCTTNVEIEITDRSDACMVKGHHNLLFCGDFARRFRLFAQMHRMRLAETGFTGTWPL